MIFRKGKKRKKHIMFRMNLFLFALLAVLSVVFAGSMGETAVMVLNSFYDHAEYPVRLMEAFYTSQLLDECVRLGEKTPELIEIDERMRNLVMQENSETKGMVILYTDDGNTFRYLTCIGEKDAAFGQVFNETPEEGDYGLAQLKKAFDKGKSFPYYQEIDSLKEWFRRHGNDDVPHLMSIEYLTDSGLDDLQVQMIRGEHTYFLCADVGGIVSIEGDGESDAELYLDGAVGVVATNLIKIVVLLLGHLLIIYVTAFVLMFFLIRRTVANPIQKLEKAAGDLSSMMKTEDDPKQWKYNDPAIRTGDEIESLSETFHELAHNLKYSAIELVDESANRERLKTELSLANNIQQNALIRDFPAFPGRDDFDIIASMTPAKEVGGDFYDFFLVDDDHLAFLVADVSSKGVPAALFMMQAMTMLHSGLEFSQDVDDILSHVNSRLCKGNEENMFVTCWLGVMELSTGRLTCANAGHEPAYLIRGGACSEIEAEGGLVLAAFEDSAYESTTITLQHGDKIFLFTDGLNEAQNSQKELYGFERLQASLTKHAAEDITAMQDSVLKDMADFVDGADQFDDLTVLIFAYK